MDSQFKIKLMAEQQGQAMKDMLEFIESQKLKDEKAQIEADKFDSKSVILPSVRGVNNPQADIEFAKEQANKLFKEKKFKEALEAYTDIIDGGLEISNEMKSTLYFNAGLCLQKLKRPDGAVLDKFDAAIQLNPEYQKARVMRARVYMRQERWQDALDDFYASGRDQNAIQDDIQKCIQNLPKSNNLIIEESSSDEQSEQNNGNTKENNQKQKDLESNQKHIHQQNKEEVSYTPNYSIQDGQKTLFYSKIREFENYPKNLGQFLAQFHSSKLGEYIEELQNNITLLEMEHILVGCMHSDSGFTPIKLLNFMYQVFSMNKFKKDAEFMGESTIDKVQNLIKQLKEVELTDVQQERLDYLNSIFSTVSEQQ